MKDSKSLKWLYKNSKGHRHQIVILSLSNMVLALIGTSIALISKYAIDAAQKAAGAVDHDEFVHYRNLIILFGVIMLVVIVARMLLRIFAQSLQIKVQAKLEMEMRSKLFTSILSKQFDKVNTYHSGELMNRITSDIKIATNGLANLVPDILYYITQFAGAFIVLAVFDWRFTLVFLAVGIVMSAISLVFRGRLKDLHKKVQESDGKVRSFFQESIESMLVVKTFGVEDRFGKKGDDLQQINYDYKMRRRRITIFANSGFSFVFNSGYLFALIWCAVKVSTKAMTYGTLTAVLQLISQVQTPFVNITKIIPEYYSILASTERVMEIEDIPKEQKSKEQLDVDAFYRDFAVGRFEDIQFNYGREIVFEQGNAFFEKGDFVAVRGISGIGKSTLMKMLLGVFSPDKGNIRLYRKDGSFLEAGPDTRCLFSYVPQGNYLFSGTLRENIVMIKPDASPEEIDRALKISEIYDFVQTLPEGLDTVIGEKGLGISEGQAQRLAIARAILGDAPILLLDEVTSALDADTEKKVLSNIKGLNQKTCIIITHKDAALEVCNREFLIDDKKLSCAEKTQW